MILESGSVSYGKATTPTSRSSICSRRTSRSSRATTPRQIREKVTGKLLTLDRALEPLAARAAGAARRAGGRCRRGSASPRRNAASTPSTAVKRLLLREAKVQPLLVLIEDLHWIDSETQAVLDSLVESLPTARLLLLVNYRPEYQHGWGSKTYYTQLRIDPLPPESADELLETCSGQDAGLQPLKRLLIERTEGNPFFLEESVQTLVETGTLVGERGAYRLTKALEGIQVPATVQAVLAARIDRLPAEDKRLLQSAAVIGKDVPFALLQAIAELSETELRNLLTRLQAAEFLYEAQLFPDLQYTFKHALTHRWPTGVCCRTADGCSTGAS